MNRLRKTKATWNSFLIIFILLLKTAIVYGAPLTMGFGKNLKLRKNDANSQHAFELNIFSNQNHIQEMFINQKLQNYPQKNFHRVGKEEFIEVDVKHSKKKEISGVRHMFCSGYYCAFQYSSDQA